MSAPVILFRDFLRDEQNIVSTISIDLPLDKYVDKIFHRLGEDVLKSVVTKALSFRDSQPAQKEASLGEWGTIIDVIKATMIQRRDLATSNFQQLVQCGMAGEREKVDALLSKLYKGGHCDHLFLGILKETIEACKQNKQAEEHMFMLIYFLNTIMDMSVAAAELNSNGAGAASGKKAGQSLKGGSSSSAAAAALTPDEEREVQHQLVAAGNLLDSAIKEFNGNAPGLKNRLAELHSQGRLGKYFDQALQDNIDACRNAGYENKLKLLKFIRKVCDDEAYRAEANINMVNSTVRAHDIEAGISAMSTHHAPQFVGDRNAPSVVDVEGQEVLCPDSFIDGSPAGIEQKLKNNKKKAEKREAKKKVAGVAELCGDHLRMHGWAVVDNFLPLDVIRRVRIEAGLFKEHYEQSEIWVGKQSDLGAHLQVPSVRGDQVFWMCGGHMTNAATAPESGMSRVVKTSGEIEPCKIELKANAPIRRFNAIKELMAAMDKFMNEMKCHVVDLSGLFERSDVMLACYPGGGSRFANHIDNTTEDGRRITVLVYLNPNWTKDMGGALRITEPGAPDGSRPTRLVDVLPQCGRLAMFYSARIPHEVRPTFGDRHACTIWYYDTEERQKAVAAAKEGGRAEAVAKTSEASQLGAKAFIADLMGGDEVGADGGNPTQSELEKLREDVRGLSDEILGIVSSITGAPSVASFREGFELLVPEDLKSMRQLFRKMGLQD